MNNIQHFTWAEQLSPRLLKSPWWIGHIPFAFELVGRLRPSIVVELGTYSGSSFAAFCQAAEACGSDTKCYGVDLWAGDIHMGKFDEELYVEIASYMSNTYPGIATLLRKDFNVAAADFEDKSIDLLHIDGTHTFEAVSNDFHTWFGKLSDRAVVLFHDVNVNIENTGPASVHFGVRRFFDSIKQDYPHFEFAHCWGLGVLVVGARAPAEVMELVGQSMTPEFNDYFEQKGAVVSKHFESMAVPAPLHSPYADAHAQAVDKPTESVPQPVWRRAVNKLGRIVSRMR